MKDQLILGTIDQLKDNAVFKSLTRFSLIIIGLGAIFLSGAAYSNGSKAVGTARALVIGKILSISNAEKQNSVVLTKDQAGNMFYNIQSEPNSVVSACYQTKNHNQSSPKSTQNIAKTKLKYRNNEIVLDKNGNGSLKIDSRIFVADNTNKKGDVVYVDLFY